VQWGETLLYDPAVPAQPGIMLLAATGDDRLDPGLANLLAVFVMVVAAIGAERIRTLGAGCPPAGSHAGGQAAQGRGGHIDTGRADKHAEAPGRTWAGPGAVPGVLTGER
jgi:hypothetical protein